MGYIRPFNIDAIAAGDAGPWLVSVEEGLGCSIRIRRGGGAEVVPDICRLTERYALVLAGAPRLLADGHSTPIAIGEVAFIPDGVPAAVAGDEHSCWLEIEAALAADLNPSERAAVVISVDQSRFEGHGFAHQSLVDRSTGSRGLRLNVVQVAPGSGSPDFHIHAFTQIYFILEGKMTIDIGRSRMIADENSVVVLPQGVVHRNFNASTSQERHVSLLVPEPEDGAIFDYAVEIRDVEAELLSACPA